MAKLSHSDFRPNGNLLGLGWMNHDLYSHTKYGGWQVGMEKGEFNEWIIIFLTSSDEQCDDMGSIKAEFTHQQNTQESTNGLKNKSSRYQRQSKNANPYSCQSLTEYVIELCGKFLSGVHAHGSSCCKQAETW